MSLAQCIKSHGDFTLGEFVQFQTASHNKDLILITTEVKTYSSETLKHGTIIREESGQAYGRVLFNEYFKIME